MQLFAICTLYLAYYWPHSWASFLGLIPGPPSFLFFGSPSVLIHGSRKRGTPGNMTPFTCRWMRGGHCILGGGGGGVHIQITYQTPPSNISLSTACDKSSLAFPMIFHLSSASVCYTERKSNNKKWEGLGMRLDIPPEEGGRDHVIATIADIQRSGSVDTR